MISYWRNPELDPDGSLSSTGSLRRHGQGVGGDTVDTVTSYLTISSVTAKDSGNYSCAPDNARPAIINLHVIKGERLEKVGVSSTLCLPSFVV